MACSTCRAGALRAQVADYLAAVVADANDAARPPPKLLITPHAGYEYCAADGPLCSSSPDRLRMAATVSSRLNR